MPVGRPGVAGLEVLSREDGDVPYNGHIVFPVYGKIAEPVPAEFGFIFSGPLETASGRAFCPFGRLKDSLVAAPSPLYAGNFNGNAVEYLGGMIETAVEVDVLLYPRKNTVNVPRLMFVKEFLA
jgi:hypothetical protein